MTLYDIPLRTLSGEATSLGDYRDQAVLVVNVASKCGLTPQYAGLERLQKEYGDRGFTVLGVPCNQFGGQEPGSARRSPRSARRRTGCPSRCWRRRT
ncbi:glutathione peroxidase [Streptomyces pristinaespiralis]|uniref:Glutathione peroxidase n=1 Tax=Streptomyces pristinaespiralis TaxID=38300 RepID=A0A0M5IV43_STRPR|nr:glutathione peroxidase [Streptomyces pristinaespiralis]